LIPVIEGKNRGHDDDKRDSQRSEGPKNFQSPYCEKQAREFKKGGGTNDIVGVIAANCTCLLTRLLYL
jgi:hypothetical protein